MKDAKIYSEKYVDLLHEQIKQSGQWLIDNAEEIVSKIINITDFEIRIKLKNGDQVPTIETRQENMFFDFERYWGNKK